MSDWTKVVILDISSYVGASIGATHTYGELLHKRAGESKKVQIERPMTQSEATRENKKDLRQGFKWNRNKPGQPTSRLKDRMDVVRVAESVWRDHFPYASILLERRAWSSEPGVIWQSLGDKVWQSRLNNMWSDWQAAVDEDWGRDEIDQLSRDWLDEFERYLDSLPEVGSVPDEESIGDDYDEAMALFRENQRRERQEQEWLEAKAKEQRRKERQAFQEWYDAQEFDEIEITVKARTTFAKKEDGHKAGVLTFFMACADAFDDNGQKIGSVKSGVDASVWLRHHTQEDLYRITVPDLWAAFERALQEREVIKLPVTSVSHNGDSDA